MNQITEEERAKIEKDARRILDNFSSALGKVEFRAERREVKESSGFRNEGDGMKADEDFRKRMLENAPNKNEDSIIAERKKW